MNSNPFVSTQNARVARLAVFVSLLILPVAPALPKAQGPQKSRPAADPWTASQTIQPAALAAEIQQKENPRPQVIYVGVRTLYNGAHIPGAVFQGPGSSPEGIAALKNFASTLPRNSQVVLYCGCCPLEKCPNIRPAFRALQEMGFKNVRVLILPTSFAVDWVQKGYSIEKSQ